MHLKLASKREIQKIAEATGDLIGNTGFGLALRISQFAKLFLNLSETEN